MSSHFDLSVSLVTSSDSEQSSSDDETHKPRTIQSKLSSISFPDYNEDFDESSGDRLANDEKHKVPANKTEYVCNIHTKDVYDPHTFPPPSDECKAVDGHGQKARVIIPSEFVDLPYDKHPAKAGILSTLMKRIRRLF